MSNSASVITQDEVDALLGFGEDKAALPRFGRRECLDAAAACVLTDRNNEYGGPEDSFGAVHTMWQAYDAAASKRGPHIVDVAMKLVLLKVARIAANPTHADSFVDIAGYAACGAEVSHGEGEG